MLWQPQVAARDSCLNYFNFEGLGTSEAMQHKVSTLHINVQKPLNVFFLTCSALAMRPSFVQTSRTLL